MPKQAPQAPAPQWSGPQLRFEPEDGQEWALGFSLATTANIEIAAFMAAVPGTTQPRSTERTKIDQRASGALNLKFYPAGQGLWTVAATVANSRYTLNGEDPSYAADLENPFSFRMTERGVVSGFEHARGTDPAAALFLSQLVQSMQVVLPDERVRQWRAEEQDASGRYLAEYFVEGENPDAPQGAPTEWVVRKDKLEYLSNRAAASGLMPRLGRSVVKLQDDDGTAVVSARGAWIRSLDQSVELAQTANDELLATSNTTLSAWPVDRTASVAFPTDAAQFAATLKSAKFLLADIQRTDPRLDRMAEKLDLNGALNTYRQLLHSGTPGATEAAERFLVNYLKLKPEASAELIEQMNRESAAFGGDEDLTLWRLLAKAGTPDAQNAVMAAAQNPDNREATRIRALAYVSDFAYPTDDLVGHLWNEYQRQPPGNTGELGSEVRTMSLFALGILGHDDKLNDAVKPLIRERLVSSLNNAANPWDRAMALRAIGNYGNADVLDDVAPFLTDPNPDVRSAAYWSLRRVDDSAAAEMLMTAFDEEGDANVRSTALRTLTQMVPTAGGMEWAKWELTAVTDSAEQIALAQYLGNALPKYPQNAIALRQLLETNPPTAVKRAIYAYIAPRG